MKIERNYLHGLLLAVVVISSACQCSKENETVFEENKDYHQIYDTLLGVGFRFSAYGPQYNPGKEYWLSVAQQMVSKFKDSQGECIWIVGTLNDKGCYLNFPVKKQISIFRLHRLI